jgi:hypothetical protein
MKRQSLLRDPTLLPALLAAAAVLWCMPWIAPGVARPTLLWRGYYTVAAPMGSRAAAHLARTGWSVGSGHLPVTRASAPVLFTDFSGMETVRVAGLGERLDPADPRLDPYMRGLNGYFASVSRRGAWEVAYVPAERGRVAAFLALRRVLGRGWRMADLDPAAALFSSACVLAYALILCLPLEKRRRRFLLPTLGCAVLWLPAASGGGPAVMALFYLLFTPWQRLMEEILSYARDAIIHDWRDPSQRAIAEKLSAFLILCAAAALLLALAVDRGQCLLFTITGTILASLLLLAVPFPVYTVRRTGRRRRTPFEPVPIIRRRAWPVLYRRAAAGLAAASLAGLCALAAFRGAPAPAPQKIPGLRSLSWASLSGSLAAARPAALPGAADAVAHAAYQETLGFGREYRLPLRGEVFAAEEYSWSANARAVVRARHTVAVFDDAWLARALRGAGPGSVEELLEAQGRPVMAAPRGQAWPVLRDLPFALLCLAGLAAGLLMDPGLGSLISAALWRFNVQARRRQPL